MSSCVFNLDKYNNLKSCAFWCNYNNYEYLDDIKHNSKKDYEDWVKFPFYFNITATGDALYNQGDRGCKKLPKDTLKRICTKQTTQKDCLKFQVCDWQWQETVSVTDSTP